MSDMVALFILLQGNTGATRSKKMNFSARFAKHLPKKFPRCPRLFPAFTCLIAYRKQTLVFFIQCLNDTA